MEWQRLNEIYNMCLARNISFVSWRLPNDDTINTLLTRQQPVKVFQPVTGYRGFVFAPFAFSEKRQALFFVPDVIFQNDEFPSEFLTYVEGEKWGQRHAFPYLAGQDEYFKQFQQVKDELDSGEAEKVVLSRTIEADAKISEAPDIFRELTDRYPYAMVYLLHIAGGTTWVGASPEPLLLGNDEEYETSSIAATRPLKGLNGNHQWSAKETSEQTMVTEYIAKVLSEFSIGDYEQSGPKTIDAGNVMHLMTNFSFHKQFTYPGLNMFLQALHPTPAVCGVPKYTARDIIKSIEKHDRSFYAGFLGPVGIHNSMDLFVNIRCMQLFDNKSAIYAGGGITSDSDAKEEWDEIVHKADTIIQAIKATKKRSWFQINRG